MDASRVEELMMDHQESWYDWCWETPLMGVEVLNLGHVTLVDSKPGLEGGGENIHMIFKVEFSSTDYYHIPSKYYRVDGYYASYDGSTWDGDLYEVTPQQKTITVYEKIS